MGDPGLYNVPGIYAPGVRPDCPGINLPSELLETLPPHFSKDTIRPGSYTKHGLGLSFLIAPAYALGKRPLVVVLVAALAALLGVNLWLLAFETTGHRRVAWLVWAIMGFLNFFSMMFANKPLMTAGGPKREGPNPRHVMLWGKMIDAEKNVLHPQHQIGATHF